jgi:hypothetical protein
MEKRWRIWIRPSPDEDWAEPVISSPGSDVGWRNPEDAETIADGFRDSMPPTGEIRVLPEGQHPDDAPRSGGEEGG